MKNHMFLIQNNTILILNNMLKISLIIIIMLISLAAIISAGNLRSNSNSVLKSNSDNPNISEIKVKTMDGAEKPLSDYKGKVLLIVNVASNCGNTPQYEGLEKIYEKYKDRGFEILAFPCNDFGGQEPGTNEEIRNFCTANYNVTFTLFDKIKVLGDSKSALYAELIKTEPAGDVGWNFEKFIVDKNGNVIARFKSKVKPEDNQITSVIEKYLEQS
jgi:glutathione peroxidase